MQRLFPKKRKDILYLRKISENEIGRGLVLLKIALEKRA